jgi:hypothetical protein
MIGVTVFGIYLTPVFYYVIRGLVPARAIAPAAAADAVAAPSHPREVVGAPVLAGTSNGQSVT